MKKLFITIFILALIAAASALWRFNRPLTLIELQKQYLFAKTEDEKEQIIDRLEKYYLNLDIPSAICDSIDHDFTGLLKKTNIDLSIYNNGKAEDKNPYALENDLRNLVKNALVAQARNESETFRQLMDHAHNMAVTVDSGTQNNYWVAFVERVSLFSQTQAISWLKADLAQARCKAYQDSESRFRDAEFYASLGLQHLQQANDERLRLDMMQRLQFILYEYLSMYELSLGLAKKLLPQVDQIKYHIRSNGIVYHQAQALARKGENQTALAFYDKVIDNAEKFKQIPLMDFFTIAGLLGRGEVYLKLGEFGKAFDDCNKVEKHVLKPRDKIRLQMLKGDIYISTANYEQAEEELKNTMRLAETASDAFNLIACLNNWGVMFEHLKEYDLALDYYNQAKSLFTSSSPEITLRVRVFNNIADALVAKNDYVQFEKISQEARRLVKLANLPSREVELLRNLGNMHKKAEKYIEAISYFQEAAAICDTNGLLPFSLGTKIDLVDCLIGLSRLNEAQSMLSEIQELAEEIDDNERTIDANGRLAKIQYKEGNIAKAAESSEKVLQKIEAMSSRFNSADRLMAYRQKIYDLLKDAVLYEIASQHIDSAFIRLDYAKAYALKSQLIFSRSNNHSAASQKHFNLDSISANLYQKSLVIDYMVTENTLYAFVLDFKGLQLLSKNLKIENLKETVDAYKDSVNRTIQIFQHYNADQVNLHYAGTVACGQKLYEYLFEWPELKYGLQQAELLYIIPDEFLYEVPFSSLIAKSSDTQTFVVAHAAVLTLLSSSFLRAENTAPVPDKLNTKKVLISADQRFPGSEKFILKAKELFPLAEELMITKADFTEDDVLAKLKEEYQIYIFIGHGSANSKYPDQSYIELSVKTPNTSSAKIVRLSLAALKKINWLGTEMVMLVGCETASDKLYRGTGTAGLLQGFLSLGVQTVLGNLWEVDANHAIAQAQDFLTVWAETCNAPQALRVCQLKAIQELKMHSIYKQPHPYFWGSSILLTAKHQ